MKKLFLLSGGIFLLLNGWLFAQKGRTVQTNSSSASTNLSKKDIESLPFSRGKWEYGITMENLGYSHQNITTNGVDQGSQSRFALDLGANYYVADHIGIGLELDADMSTFKNNGKQTSNSWMGYANFTYGTSISKDFNFYARAGVGIGGITDKYTPPTGQSTTDKADEFGYKFSVGFPIQLERNDAVYFTPVLGYRYNRLKYDNNTETDTRFGVGLKLETFLSCGEVGCNSHSGYKFSKDIYSQGHSYLGVSTRGMVSFGNLKTTYTGNYPSEKQDHSETDLSANYMYYIVNNLSLGLDLDFSNSIYKNSAANYKQSNNGFAIAPMFELNIPSKNEGLNNLFIRGGYGFGSQRSEYKSGNTNNTTKFSTTDFCAGFGYNCFFHKGLSLTPVFEYECATYKNKDNNQKEKLDGPDFSIGIRKFF